MMTLIEELSLLALPAFETEVYDGWVLRFAGGYTKRANSVNPLYPSAIDPAEKIAYCEKAYKDRGLPAVFKLTAQSTPAGLDRELEKRGYDRLDETSVRVLSLRDKWDAPSDIDIANRLTGEWLHGFARCSGIGDTDTVEKLNRILNHIAGETLFASVPSAEGIIACGLGVMGAGYLGCFDIVVDKAHRKMGHGRRIMEGLLAEGARQGAETAYLQVVVGNAPAEKLYESLGFREAYRYWYRMKKIKFGR